MIQNNKTKPQNKKSNSDLVCVCVCVTKGGHHEAKFREKKGKEAAKVVATKTPPIFQCCQQRDRDEDEET